MAKFAHVAVVIMHVAADIASDAAKSGQKFPCLKAVLLFFEIFFGIFNGENTFFFKKFSKNGLVSEKNYFIFFPLLGRGG